MPTSAPAKAEVWLRIICSGVRAKSPHPGNVCNQLLARIRADLWDEATGRLEFKCWRCDHVTVFND